MEQNLHNQSYSIKEAEARTVLQQGNISSCYTVFILKNEELLICRASLLNPLQKYNYCTAFTH